MFKPNRSRIPMGIWILGFVSLLMDVSSEMVHSLLPLFLVGTLGISVVAVGLIEGLAESTALISKVRSRILPKAAASAGTRTMSPWASRCRSTAASR